MKFIFSCVFRRNLIIGKRNWVKIVLNIDIWWSNLLGWPLNHVLCVRHDTLSQRCPPSLACLPMANWFCYCYPFPNRSLCACYGRKTSPCTDRTIHTWKKRIKKRVMSSGKFISNQWFYDFWSFLNQKQFWKMMILNLSRSINCK